MERLQLIVCPHDTADDPERWFVFTQYLNQRLEGVRIGFGPVDGFDAFRERMARTDLVYANPQDAHRLSVDHGHRLLMSPSNLFDEVVIVASPNQDADSLAAIDGQTVATVPELLPTCQALASLRAAGVRPAALHPCDSWLSVMNAVARRQAPFGFVYRDYFDRLGHFSRRMVRVLQRGDTRSARHALLTGTRAAPWNEPLGRLLAGMHEDPAGRRCLDSLGIASWEPPHPTTLERIDELRASCRL